MYTQEQVNQLTEALSAFAEQELPRGLIHDESHPEDSPMLKVTEWMIKNDLPATVDGIKQAVAAHEKAGYKLYYEPYVVTYNNEFQQLSRDAQKVFNEFWNSTWITGQLVTGSSQSGYENATKFLVWMRGRNMDKAYLEMAFSNLAAKGQLKFVTKSYKFSETAQKAGEHKPGQFWTDSQKQEKEWQRQEAQRKADAEAARNNPAPADALYKEKWDRLQGNSYAQTSRVRAILINKPDGTPDYKAMYNAGLALLDESNRQPLDRY
jgi:hypothetical protein